MTSQKRKRTQRLVLINEKLHPRILELWDSWVSSKGVCASGKVIEALYAVYLSDDKKESDEEMIRRVMREELERVGASLRMEIDQISEVKSELDRKLDRKMWEV